MSARPLCLHCHAPISAKNCDKSMGRKRKKRKPPAVAVPPVKIPDSALVERLLAKGYNIEELLASDGPAS